MKKIISLVLSFAMLLSLTAGMDFSAYADELTTGSCGKNVTYSFDSSTGTLTISGTGDMYDYYNNSPFDSNDSIKSVIIQDGVKSIGRFAFSSCSGITALSIPDSVSSINHGAFIRCSALTEVTIPDGVKILDNFCFALCTSLLDAHIPQSVVSMGNDPFSACVNLESITVDENNSVFDSRNDCNAIIKTDTHTLISGCQNTRIPQNVLTIAYGAFYGQNKLTSLIVPVSVRTIESTAFCECTHLSDIYYEGSEIEWNAISIDSDNEPLTDATIHYNYIQPHVHEYTATVVLPTDMMTHLPDSLHGYVVYTCKKCGDSYTGGYTDCYSGKCGDNVYYSFEPSTGVLTISGSGDMYDYSAAEHTTEGVVEITNPFCSIEGITSIVIEDGVTGIGNAAFVWCRGVESISIPKTVTSIGYMVFQLCDNLTTICIDSENPVYDSRNNCNAVIETETNTLISGCKNTVIPNTVTALGGDSFSGLFSLTQITIPDSVTTIGSYAFSHCIALESIEIPDSVTEIGSSCFYHCTGLESATLSGGMTSVADTMFLDCSNLKNVTIPDGYTGIESGAFCGCSSLTSIEIPQSVTSIGTYAFEGSGLTRVTIPDGVTKIQSETFKDCKDLTEIVIPYNVVSIQIKAFQGCTSFSDIYYKGSAELWNNVRISTYYEDDSYIYNATVHYNYVPRCEVHTWDGGAYAPAPTCTEDGTILYTCTVCGETYTETADALGHNIVTDEAVAPTCTNDGLTEGSHCPNCGEVFTAQEVIPATGHSYDLISSTATCTSSGYMIYVCSVCHNSMVEMIDALDHTPSYVAEVAPTCIATGLTAGTVCSVCGITLSGREPIAKANHTYEVVAENSRPATCTETGMNYYRCTVCGDSYTSNLALLPHQYEITEKVDSTPNERGYEIFTCSECGTFYKEHLPYASDNSALLAALLKASIFGRNDFSEDSFEAFQQICAACDVIADKDSSQAEIDNAITQIITAINSLVPYASIGIEAENGSVTVSYNGETYTDDNYSILYGTPFTLTATADEGYEFAGWYETNAKRIFSMNAEYTLYATSNMSFRALFNKMLSATLSFENESGWIADTITKTASEWSETESIESFLPDVPYKLGYENGRWDYDEAEVLSKLRNGEDVVITAVYDKSEEEPEMPAEPDEDNIPTLNLGYWFNGKFDTGSFIMRANIPQNCRVYSIAIAFAYGKRSNFNPNDIYLTNNNKLYVTHYDCVDKDGIYIADMLNISRFNWAAVGYVTYFDENNELKTVYSNQVNIINNKWVR